MVEHEITYYSSFQEAFLSTEGRSNNTMVEHKITSSLHCKKLLTTEEATITRGNNTKVEQEQKRKIEIGYVNINNTGNIQNSSSNEEKHSIQPVAQTNYQEVRTQENRLSKYWPLNSLAMVSPHIDHKQMKQTHMLQRNGEILQMCVTGHCVNQMKQNPRLYCHNKPSWTEHIFQLWERWTIFIPDAIKRP